MADEFNTTNINWWDSSSSRNRFDSGSSSSSSSSSSSTTTNINSSSFGWPIRSSIDSSTSVSGNSRNTSVATDHNLHLMGSHDWNQPLLGDKSEENFGSMLQENLNSTSSCMGFSFDPHAGISSDSTVSLPSSFQMDSSATNLYQGTGILGSDNQIQNFHYGSNNSFGMNMNMSMNRSEVLLPSSSSAAAGANKFPQFLRTSPPKQQPQHTHLHFSNNAPFWNASNAGAGAGGSSMNEVRSPNFFPSLETRYDAATQSFEEKPKHHVSEVRHSSITAAKKSSGTEPASKRAKNDQTASPLPAFKVKKEKMGDRITALQQLVSPFGKTDTASVLSEAIEYIKFLHEQVAQVLSTPYMKSGAPIPYQQNSEKAKESEGPKQDLRSRGLCLVPVSSTYPVTHETTMDFWNPTFGGTFR